MPPPPSPAPFTITVGDDKFHIREARYDELDRVGWAAGGAFLDDRIMNYFGHVTKPATSINEPSGTHIAWFYAFLMKTCHLSGGRIVIALSSSSPTDSIAQNGENIAGASCWYPPGKRMKMKHVLKGGVLKVFKAWGRLGLKRADDFAELAHGVFDKAFHGLSPSKMGKELKQVDAWYLHIIFTSKPFEGRGIMSLLMREGYAYARSQSNTYPFMLESSSERSRDRYAHLGYELVEPKTLLGTGKVDSRGIKPPKPPKTSQTKKGNLNSEEKLVTITKLEGVAYYCMVNWNPDGETPKSEA